MKKKLIKKWEDGQLLTFDEWTILFPEPNNDIKRPAMPAQYKDDRPYYYSFQSLTDNEEWIEQNTTKAYKKWRWYCDALTRIEQTRKEMWRQQYAQYCERNGQLKKLRERYLNGA